MRNIIPLMVTIGNGYIVFGTRYFPVSIYRFLNNRRLFGRVLSKVGVNRVVDLVFDRSACLKREGGLLERFFGWMVPQELLDVLEDRLASKGVRVGVVYVQLFISKYRLSSKRIDHCALGHKGLHTQ